MAENQTIMEAADQQRWCWADVEKGKDSWPQGAAWHPFPLKCKATGRRKINGEWRCKRHMPKETIK